MIFGAESFFEDSQGNTFLKKKFSMFVCSSLAHVSFKLYGPW